MGSPCVAMCDDPDDTVGFPAMNQKRVAIMVASVVSSKLCPFRREGRSGCGVPLICSNVYPVRGLWTLDSVQALSQPDYLFCRNILAL